MKKLLGSALALALFVSVGTANAELLKNFKFGGSVEVDAVSARNTRNFNTRSYQNNVPNDHIGTAQTRIMLNMDWDLLDDVHAKVTLRKNNRVYGNASERLQGTGAGTGVSDNIFVDQGYFKIDKVFGFVDSTFGRQFFGEPGDLVAYYGPKYDQYGMDVTAIDGARFDWIGEKAYATAVAFEPTTNGTTLANGAVNAQNRKDIRGFIVGNKGNENVDGKVYLWNQVTHAAMDTSATLDPNTKVKNDNLYVAGFKVKGKVGGLYGDLEAALNFGENRSNFTDAFAVVHPISERYCGKALIANVGMKADVDQIGMFNPWYHFSWIQGNGDTGNAPNHNMAFTAIASDYRPGALYGRFQMLPAATAGMGFGTGVGAGVTALGNTALMTNGNGLVVNAIGVKATPSALNKLTAGLAYYNFRAQNISKNGGGGRSGTQETLTGGHNNIGSEIDVTGEWKHSENVSLKGTVGNFQPGGMIMDNANRLNASTTNSAWLSALDVSVKF